MTLNKSALQLRLLGKQRTSRPKRKTYTNDTPGSIKPSDVDSIVEDIYTELNSLDSTLTSLSSTVDDLPPEGNLFLTTTFTQAEVRTLNSANSGSGLELIPAPGEGLGILLKSVVAKYSGTGGSFTDAEVWVYYEGGGAAIFLGNVYNSVELPDTSTLIFSLEAGSYVVDNTPVYVYTDTEQTAFEGTWTFFVEYKIINVA